MKNIDLPMPTIYIALIGIAFTPKILNMDSLLKTSQDTIPTGLP
jgi:hypothetical protein